MRNVGLDLGYGGVKVYEPGKETQIASFIGTVNDYSEPSAETCIVSFGGISLMVGRDVYSAGTEQPSLSPDRWLGGNEALAAFFAGMGTHFKGNKQKDPLSLYVGLPASLTSVSVRAETQAKVSGWLVGEHFWEYNGKRMSVIVENVMVRSQASGAIFDLIHTLNGDFSKDVEYLDRGVGIASIGFNTVELSGGINGRPAANMMISSASGIQALLQQCATNKRAGIAYLDSQLRSGDFGDVYEANRARWAKSIIGMMETKWSLLDSLKRVMVVGGGAQYAEPELRARFGDRLYIPTSPIFSVSRGLYKMAVVDGKSA